MSRRGAIHRGVIAGVLAAGILVAGAATYFLNRHPVPAEFIKSLDSPAERFTRLVISDDGEFLAAGSSTGEVFVWRVAGERRIQPGKATGSAIVSLAFAPDGLLLAGDATGRLRGWPSPDFTELEIESPKLPVTCFAFHETDGHQQTLLGLSDGRLIAVDTDGHTSADSGHAGLKALAVTDGGKTVISSGTDGQLIWRDLSVGQIRHKVQAHQTEVPVLAWSPDRERLVSADWNGLVKIHEPAQRTSTVLMEQPDAVSALVWREDQIITGSWDGCVRIWSVEASSARLTHSIHTGRPIYGLIVLREGSTIATVSGGRSVDLWKLLRSPVP